MLVLTRKVGESLKVGEIEIKLLKVQGKRASIGIDAPREIQVTRKEKERE